MCKNITKIFSFTSVIPEVYMGIVLPKAAGMQEIPLLHEEMGKKGELYTVVY